MTMLPLTINAFDVAPRTRNSVYPEPFASMMSGRIKRVLGDVFELTNFGVNITVLEPGAISSLKHSHTKQDEFIYAIEGQATLKIGDASRDLTAGICAGFKAGSSVAHHIVNTSNERFVYLEIGDRLPGDSADYPDHDLVVRSEKSQWIFSHKNGMSY